MNRFTATFFLLFCFNSVSAQEVSHIIDWRSGVNQKTVEEWSRSLSKISNVSSKTYVRKKPGGKDSLHRKGHRDVIVWIPDSSDLTKHYVVENLLQIPEEVRDDAGQRVTVFRNCRMSDFAFVW